MENCLCTIPDTNLVEIESASFAIPANMSIQGLDGWKEMLTGHSEFSR